MKIPTAMGASSPLFAATLGALLTTWVTFLPCFLWVFLGGPHIEQLRGNVTLATTLSTITAAIVGVMLNQRLFVAFAARWNLPPGSEPSGLALDPKSSHCW